MTTPIHPTPPSGHPFFLDTTSRPSLSTIPLMPAPPSRQPSGHTLGWDTIWKGLTRRSDGTYTTDVRDYVRTPYDKAGIPIDIDADNRERMKLDVLSPIPGHVTVASPRFSPNPGPAALRLNDGRQYLNDSPDYGIPIRQMVRRSIIEQASKIPGIRLKIDDGEPLSKIAATVLPSSSTTATPGAVREVSLKQVMDRMMRVNGFTPKTSQGDAVSTLSHERNHLANHPTANYSNEVVRRNAATPGFSSETYARLPQEAIQALAARKRAELTRGVHIKDTDAMRDSLVRLYKTPEDQLHTLRPDEQRLHTYLHTSVNDYNKNAARRRELEAAGVDASKYKQYEDAGEDINIHPVFRNITGNYREAIPMLRAAQTTPSMLDLLLGSKRAPLRKVAAAFNDRKFG